MKNKEQRNFRAFSIMLNDEEAEILRRLRCEYCINISGTMKKYLREKLEELDKQRDDKNK
ncbi:MAG: hypothetical protein WCH76_07805 [Candidatus Riflemargulisbacteria bacterium]